MYCWPLAYAGGKLNTPPFPLVYQESTNARPDAPTLLVAWEIQPSFKPSVVPAMTPKLCAETDLARGVSFEFRPRHFHSELF